MGWEKHGGRAYYYRSLRVGGRVTKVYCGGGAVGRTAAAADVHRREERQAELAARLGAKARLEEARGLVRQLQARCELLAQATLLASGFHRPKRVQWRKWHAARTAQDGDRARDPC